MISSPTQSFWDRPRLDKEQPLGQQSLKGKIAIISGSCTGIGVGIAHELSNRGATVVINYPWPALKSAAEEVCASLVTPGIVIKADLATTTGPGKLVADTVMQYGRVDILVNNAGTYIQAPLEEATLDHWDTLVNLNGRGTFLLTKAVCPHLVHGVGRIVNIVSVASRAPPPDLTILAGSKGMVDSFTRCWAKELPPKYGCTVNAVTPGPTRTAGLEAGGTKVRELVKPLLEATPSEPRLAEPSEIAYAVAMLCEERARWINGAHLTVNGGLVVG